MRLDGLALQGAVVKANGVVDDSQNGSNCSEYAVDQAVFMGT
jgi:hypothetical protein